MGIKVELIRPLDGKPIGSVVEYPDADAKELERTGVVAFHKEKAAPKPAAPHGEKPAAPEEKAAPEPLNKMAQSPLNKAAAPHRVKKGA